MPKEDKKDEELTPVTTDEETPEETPTDEETPEGEEEQPVLYSEEELQLKIQTAISEATEPLIQKINELEREKFAITLSENGLNLSEDQLEALDVVASQQSLDSIDQKIQLANRLFAINSEVGIEDKIKPQVDRNKPF